VWLINKCTEVTFKVHVVVYICIFEVLAEKDTARWFYAEQAKLC